MTGRWKGQKAYRGTEEEQVQREQRKRKEEIGGSEANCKVNERRRNGKSKSLTLATIQTCIFLKKFNY